jgi:hypothetical protein
VSIRHFSKGQITLITEYKKGSAIRELLPLFSPFLYYSCGGGGVGKGGGGGCHLHSSQKMHDNAGLDTFLHASGNVT